MQHTARDLGMLISTEMDGSKYRVDTTCFYAFFNIPKSPPIVVNFLNSLVCFEGGIFTMLISLVPRPTHACVWGWLDLRSNGYGYATK